MIYNFKNYQCSILYILFKNNIIYITFIIDIYKYNLIYIDLSKVEIYKKYNIVDNQSFT